ncbi:PREDICTED: transmembrane protein 26 [Acromyrmex echinatior]|uniref:transmembrane protein 26 n=1 Tax=Acromyrmex echinatior TaxID=103372 RepID=UPI000580C211|nr:PREDICTED: transmembrane protein 26 [Acromyrmex echinatior]
MTQNQMAAWFCPSVFLYLSSVVPAIWLLELDKVDIRLKSRGTNINISENIDLSNLAADDLKHLEEALGVDIRLPDIQISTETWVTLIEQFLMLILIIGRWMLPKGDLTRDQLSQLLLVYIGTAADIIEFFDSFKEDRIAREPVLVYLTLGIWAWSLTQFTVVLTATKSRKSRLSSGSVIRKKVRTETSCCSIDVWGIALNMILQDGPFLAFRLILIIHYQIVSYMNIFFTCKNTLVILLQLYRLYVVQTENKSKRNKKYSKRDVLNINTISRGDMYKDVRMRALRDNNKYKNRYDKDIEANYSETEDSREDIDKFDLSPKNIEGSKRKNRQDTGYSTSSSRNSSKHDKFEELKKLSCREETKRGTSNERRKRRKNRMSFEKSERKSIMIKNDNNFDRNSIQKFDIENESSSEESAECKVVREDSESKSNRRR